MISGSIGVSGTTNYNIGLTGWTGTGGVTGSSGTTGWTGHFSDRRIDKLDKIFAELDGFKWNDR